MNVTSSLDYQHQNTVQDFAYEHGIMKQ